MLVQLFCECRIQCVSTSIGYFLSHKMITALHLLKFGWKSHHTLQFMHPSSSLSALCSSHLNNLESCPVRFSSLLAHARHAFTIFMTAPEGSSVYTASCLVVLCTVWLLLCVMCPAILSFYAERLLNMKPQNAVWKINPELRLASWHNPLHLYSLSARYFCEKHSTLTTIMFTIYSYL